MSIDNNEVYQNLTSSSAKSKDVTFCVPFLGKKWNLYLFLCVITVTSASFQFGYNISSLNPPTRVLKQFIFNDTFLFKRYHVGKALFELNEGWLKGNKSKYDEELYKYEERKAAYLETYWTGDVELREKMDAERKEKEKEIEKKYNKSMTIDELFEHLGQVLQNKSNLLESKRVELNNGKLKVEKVTDYIWTAVNCLFVVGGMIGAFTSKYVLDILGRKKGILLHNTFPVVGGVLVVCSFYFRSPVCLVISRFLFGVQGGMSCSLIPTYLSEISPASLRGQTGVAHQLCLTIGILVAQILGFKEILGNQYLWHILLAMPLVPAVAGSLSLLLFFPETPKALLLTNSDVDAARTALRSLRNRANVDSDIDEIQNEAKNSSQSQNVVSFGKLLTSKKLRWSLVTSLALQIAQQLCGINAVFFYSESIFRNSGIEDNYIQYAVLSTGVVNFITTIICVLIIDRLGRKPLLVFPMAVIVVNFILLTTFLEFQENGKIFSYLSIVCVIIFIICFAIGLGPIPFVYVTECFRQDARGAALAVCMFTNWVANLFLTLFFPSLALLLKNYVFLIFAAIVLISVVIIIVKVPETKGRTVEEVIKKLNKEDYNYEKSDQLMIRSMGYSDEPEIYKNPNRPSEQINQKWTLYLFFCVMTVTLASFQFGYNISVMNSPTDILKEFISKESFLFQNVNKSLELNSTEKFQSTPEVDYIWTLVNCLFVVGGMIGAFMSKYILDTLGRKGGILFHYIFSLSGSVLVAISFYSNLPNLLILSRFLFGVQGGMSCSLIPTYLSEISPASLRGQTGVAHQLCLTIGILVAQIFGFKELLGDHSTWHFLLAFPLIPSIFGAVLLSFFFPETPKALINYRKTEAAERALIKLRNRANVNSEKQVVTLPKNKMSLLVNYSQSLDSNGR
ncbi:Solute carrier family facilitated glucose transporter member 5 [Brachionus plicatilis]|uniref:Solute carrier family facilitated glucose transporter member 5 n=1 Tax=Brachionus plicatilis TaxID=10195 RepID=A0A3M7T8W4_BRAPC|nr:Solute carrier family facilitated glucose transporter member 5 [Brachionus plicatilis]